MIRKFVCFILIQLLLGMPALAASTSQQQVTAKKAAKKHAKKVDKKADKKASKRIEKKTEKSIAKVSEKKTPKIEKILFTPMDHKLMTMQKPEKKIVMVNFGVDDDSLEPCPNMTVAKKGGEIEDDLSDEKQYTSDKTFGTADDGKNKNSGRSIASVDKEKPKPISLKKALNTLRHQTDKDATENFDE
jgi:hypothetical protein